METQGLEVENENIRKQLNASFALAGYLLEAPNEQAVILAAMKVSTELLNAEGAVFVPFNEWQPSVPGLRYGQTDFLKELDWQERLVAPATRHACRICDQKRAGLECVLLQGSAEERHIFCVSLRAEGREVGVVSYFFFALPNISADQQLFLGEMVRLTGLALEGLRARAHEAEAARLVLIPPGFKEKLLAQDAQTEALLQQLEYKAVLDERTRLAREIHDGLAQTLAFLKLEAARMQGYVSSGDVDAVSRMLQACHKTLSEAYLDARQAIDDLRHFPEESLHDWLESTALDFKKLTGIEVDVSNVRLDHVFLPGVKAQLVRIVQEALTNVRKHAQACKVTISAIERGETVILEVGDNGTGFAPEETQPASQYGLRSMRERAESIGADFQVISTPGAGTVVRLEIPVREKASL
jgi:signal transduction histidine kinase